jgi:hypothetical protein
MPARPGGFRMVGGPTPLRPPSLAQRGARPVAASGPAALLLAAKMAQLGR